MDTARYKPHAMSCLDPWYYMQNLICCFPLRMYILHHASFCTAEPQFDVCTLWLKILQRCPVIEYMWNQRKCKIKFGVSFHGRSTIGQWTLQATNHPPCLVWSLEILCKNWCVVPFSENSQFCTAHISVMLIPISMCIPCKFCQWHPLYTPYEILWT